MNRFILCNYALALLLTRAAASFIKMFSLSQGQNTCKASAAYHDLSSTSETESFKSVAYWEKTVNKAYERERPRLNHQIKNVSVFM